MCSLGSMKNIVFDLDGTLADTSGDLISAANNCFIDLGHGALLDPNLDKLIAFHGGRAMLKKGFERIKVIWTEKLIDTQYPKLLEHYFDNIDKETFLYDGAINALDRLSNNGHNLGVCTNKPENLAEILLNKLGIRSYFKAMLGSDTLSVRKPNPLHLLETINQMGGERETSVLIGDTDNDRQAALNAGVLSVLVTFGPEGLGVTRMNADAYLDHYDNLESVLDKLTYL